MSTPEQPADGDAASLASDLVARMTPVADAAAKAKEGIAADRERYGGGGEADALIDTVIGRVDELEADTRRLMQILTGFESAASEPAAETAAAAAEVAAEPEPEVTAEPDVASDEETDPEREPESFEDIAVPAPVPAPPGEPGIVSYPGAAGAAAGAAGIAGLAGVAGVAGVAAAGPEAPEIAPESPSEVETEPEATVEPGAEPAVDVTAEEPAAEADVPADAPPAGEPAAMAPPPGAPVEMPPPQDAPVVAEEAAAVAPGEESADPDEPVHVSEGVRLLATQMSVAGASSGDIAKRLHDDFGVENADRLIAHLFGPGSGPRS